MKHIKLFEEFDQTPLHNRINEIMGGNLSESEIQQMLDEGLFSWLKGLFANPRMKRELDKLANKLVDVRVEIAKIDIEENNIKAFEDELDADDDADPYAVAGAKPMRSSDNTTAIQMKKSGLEALETDIITRMDQLGEENPKLQTYINKVKLESRIQSTEKIMRMADDEIKKVLSKMVRKDRSTDKALTKELQKQMN
jgi:hypothetical protein